MYNLFGMFGHIAEALLINRGTGDSATYRLKLFLNRIPKPGSVVKQNHIKDWLGYKPLLAFL